MFSLFLLFLLFFSCSSLEKEIDTKSNISSLTKAINQDPKNVDLFLKRVDFNLERSEFESALFDLKEIIRLDSVNPINHYNIAKVYFELSKTQDKNVKFPSLVKYHLEKSISLDQKNKESYALLGELFLAYSRYEDSIKLFNLSLEIDYNQEKTHMLMGYAFKQLERTNNAINCFRNMMNI